MKISIIIPTYKPKEYFENCIKSIAVQEFEDYELLIILNGCNEPYYSQIRELISKYGLNSKTKLIQTDHPGVSNARNLGINNSVGDYITFIDDDDYISPQYLSGLRKVSSNGVVTVSNVVRINTNKQIINYTITDSYYNLKKNGFKNIFLSRRVLNSPWMKLYPRKIIGSTRFDTGLSLAEDALFNFEISRNIKKLVATEEDAIYYYNVRNGSSWTNISNKKLYSHFKRLFNKFCKVYFSNPSKYNFLFFISRLIAITISFIVPILKKDK